jgi:tripartite-type tricarboxylate transporter receptor subunit TctC
MVPSAAALAQAFPTKPIRLIVGFAAGGPTDVIARVLAQHMTSSMGQTRPSTSVASLPLPHSACLCDNEGPLERRG